MISITIDSKDLGDLARNLMSISRNAALKKISGIRLEKEVLAFEQNFALGTTVRVKLSCESGKVLIRIVSMADNEAGNAVIMKAVKAYSALSGILGGKKGGGGVAGLVESKTDGQFVRVSDDVLSLDPQSCVPFPLKLHGVSIHDGKLSLQLELF